MTTTTNSPKSSIASDRPAGSPRLPQQHRVSFQLTDVPSETPAIENSVASSEKVERKIDFTDRPKDSKILPTLQKEVVSRSSRGRVRVLNSSKAVLAQAKEEDIASSYQYRAVELDDGYEDGAERDDDDDVWAKQRALSLDGSGPQGLWQLYILQELMDLVAMEEKKSGHQSSLSSSFWKQHGHEYAKRTDFAWLKTDGEYYPCHYFDYIGGTSTGGLFAILLGRMHLSIKDAIKQYQTIWRTMAAGTNDVSLFRRIMWQKPLRKINARMFQKALMDIVSERSKHLSTYSEQIDSMFTADPIMVKTLVLSMEVKPNEQSPYLFRSYPYHSSHEQTSQATTKLEFGFRTSPKPELDDVKIWQVARATSAAPHYFSSLRISGAKDFEFIDGSLWAANPAFELYREIKSQHDSQQSVIEVLLSIGAGSTRTRNADPIREHSRHEEFKYFRFEGPKDIPSLRFDRWMKDGSGEKTDQEVRLSARKYCELDTTRKQLQECARQLVKYRQARAETDRWERFALGIYYTCDMCQAEDGLLREDRRRFDIESAKYQELSSRVYEDGVQTTAAAIEKSEYLDHRRAKSDVSDLNKLSCIRANDTDQAELRRVYSVGSQNSQLYSGPGQRLPIKGRYRPPSERELQRSALRRDREFNSSKEYVQHLVTEHDWPWPDPLWEKDVNRKMLSAAHTKVR